MSEAKYYSDEVLNACMNINAELDSVWSDDRCLPDTDLTMLMTNHGWFNTEYERKVLQECRNAYDAGVNYAYKQNLKIPDIDHYDAPPKDDTISGAEFGTLQKAWECGVGDFNAKYLEDFGKKQVKSFEFTDEERTVDDNAGHPVRVHRIRAIRDIGKDIKKGQNGGWIENAFNLRDEAWVDGEAVVLNYAVVKGHARVNEFARICDYATISGSAVVEGATEVLEHARVGDHARVYEHATVTDNATVKGHAGVGGFAKITGSATVKDHAAVDGKAYIGGHAVIAEDAAVTEQAGVVCNAWVFGSAIVRGDAYIEDDARVLGNAEVYGSVTIQGRVILDGSASVFGVNVKIGGNAKIKREEDYLLMHNNWSSGRDFAYTRSDGMWHVGCFHGTSEQLIAKAYQDYEFKGKCYEAAVNFMRARYEVNEDLPEHKPEEPVDSPRKCCMVKEEVYLE